MRGAPQSRFTPRARPQQPNKRVTKQSEQLNHRLRASPDSRQFARYRVYDKDTSPRSNQGHK
jgi:hypothetical protein